MAKRPFFTIIIPTLNEEEYLPRLLGSLAKQNFTNFEVIVVDGRSKDETLLRAKTFVKILPQLTLLVHRSANVCSQRNLGAQRGRGEYFVFFDADVVIPRSFLAKVYAVIEKKRSMLITTLVRVDSDDPRARLTAVITNIGMEAAIFINKPFVGGFNITMQRGLFKQIGGFDESVVHAEDHDLVQRAMTAGVRVTLLRSPRLVFSIRRFEKEGYWSLLQKYTTSSLYILLKGPIKKALFDYEMGGRPYGGKVVVPKGGFLTFERRLVKSIKKILTYKI